MWSENLHINLNKLTYSNILNEQEDSKHMDEIKLYQATV